MDVARKPLRNVKRWAAPGVFLALLLCLYVALVPSVDVLPYYELYNTKRVLQIFLLVALGIVLLFSRSSRQYVMETLDLLPALARWGLLTIFVLGCVSAVLAPMPRFAFLEVGHVALVFILLIGVATLYRKAPKTTTYALLGTVIVGASFYTLTFVIGYGLYLTGDNLLWPAGYSGFSHVRMFNTYQTFTLPLLLGAALWMPIRWKVVRWGVLALASVWWMLLLASGGRATALGLLVAFVLVMVFFRKRAWPWAKKYLGTLAVGAIVFWIVFQVIPSTVGLERLDDYSRTSALSYSDGSMVDRNLTSDSGRLRFWEFGGELLRQDPLLGAGPMHYAYYAQDQRLPASPHSSLVQWASEWGIPSALLLLGLVLWGGWAWIRSMLKEGNHDEREYALDVALTAALLAGSAEALVSGVIVSPLSQVLLAVTVGWAVGRWHVRHKSTSGHQVGVESPARWVLIGVLIISLSGVAWGIGDDLLTLEEQQEEFLEDGLPPEVSGYWRLPQPRYWQQGYIKAYEE